MRQRASAGRAEDFSLVEVNETTRARQPLQVVGNSFQSYVQTLPSISGVAGALLETSRRKRASESVLVNRQVRTRFFLERRTAKRFFAGLIVYSYRLESLINFFLPPMHFLLIAFVLARLGLSSTAPRYFVMPTICRQSDDMSRLSRHIANPSLQMSAFNEHCERVPQSLGLRNGIVFTPSQ